MCECVWLCIYGEDESKMKENQGLTKTETNETRQICYKVAE